MHLSKPKSRSLFPFQVQNVYAIENRAHMSHECHVYAAFGIQKNTSVELSPHARSFHELAAKCKFPVIFSTLPFIIYNQIYDLATYKNIFEAAACTFIYF